MTDEGFYPYPFSEPSHLPFPKPSLKGKVANRRFDGRVNLLPRGEGVTSVTDEGFYPYPFSEPSHLPFPKPSLKGKVANRRFDGRVLIFKAQILLLHQLLFR